MPVEGLWKHPAEEGLMGRRRFLFRTATTFGLSSFFLTSGCQSASRQELGQEQLRSYPLDELSIDALRAGLNDGRFTSRSLVDYYLRKIDEVDHHGVSLRSVLALNPDALFIADALDAERSSGRIRGPLHGIPFLVKDNLDTADKMATTAGSRALKENHARSDAFVVGQLREAGAVLLGKTNLSEWANFRSTRSSSGWSSVGGQTKNPYSLDRNPCGSSSGSAVAVAASLCAFSIGTETNGSISCPASVNGIVGLKPTVGLVSRSGIIPISVTQDTAGPMTRTVRDAAMVLAAIAGRDAKDPAAAGRPGDVPHEYVAALEKASLNGKRIGVEKSFLKAHEGVDDLLAAALRQMKEQGAVVVEVEHKKRLEGIGESEFKLLQYEFKDGLNRYLASSHAAVKSLKEVIAFNKAHADDMMPFFEQEILEYSEARGGLDENDYKKALETVTTVSRKSIDEVMEEFSLDALCGPATGPAWCTDLVNGDAFSGYGMGSAAAMAGYPSLTVPLGMVQGLPLGLLFITKAYREADLLSLGHAYEQLSKNRRAPTFRSHVTGSARLR